LSSATLIITDPNGRRSRVPLTPVPFRIGRAPDNALVLRDSRVSRNHAQIVSRGGSFVLEDLSSRHGVWLDGERIESHRILRGSERIEFGVPDGYQLHFAASDVELERLYPRPAPTQGSLSGSASLEKLKAVLEVARSLQSSFSADDVLNTVLDAALAATGAERGFLLLFDAERNLQLRSSRSSTGGDLAEEELRVPRRLIQQALESRRDLFSMSFDPTATDPGSINNTIAALELRSVVCIPLVHVKMGGVGDTQVLSTARASAGLLYLDSRVSAMDLAGGNRELLQTLAIEASTVLENARLLEEERGKQRIEEELDVARSIQQSLLPGELPETGWFVACGSSEASHQVGGDYYDVVPISPDLWSFMVADVSGKGVSASLLTTFLQGALLGASCAVDITDAFSRINQFLCDRAGHGKYATLFHATLDVSGRLSYLNAGHCAPLLLRASGALDKLDANSMPVGLTHEAKFALAHQTLMPGDRLVLYTDGVTDAHDLQGEFFGRKRLREAVLAVKEPGCRDLWTALRKTLADFTTGCESQGDDITIVVIEYGR
jgi:sigma-B regulation protein RsbU (phosphoserine phosphatase)